MARPEIPCIQFVDVRVDAWPSTCDADPLAEPSTTCADAGRHSGTDGSVHKSAISGKKRRWQEPSTLIYNGVRIPFRYFSRRSSLWHRIVTQREPAATSSKHAATDNIPCVNGNIHMDETGWYSVTPEALAIHIAEACLYMATHNTLPFLPSTTNVVVDTSSSSDPAPGCGVNVLDLFAGCGGNAIAFARQGGCGVVIAVDSSSERLEMLAHNAAEYGVSVGLECNKTNPVISGRCPARNTIVMLHADVGELLHRCMTAKDGAFDPTILRRGERSLPERTFHSLDDCYITSNAPVPPSAHRILTIHLPCSNGCCWVSIPLQFAFSAPPWGGPHYNDAEDTTLSTSTAIQTRVASDIRKLLGGAVVVDESELRSEKGGEELGGEDLMRGIAYCFSHHAHFLPRTITNNDMSQVIHACMLTGQSACPGTAVEAQVQTCLLAGFRKPVGLVVYMRHGAPTTTPG
jgi:hypothetical protein